MIVFELTHIFYQDKNTFVESPKGLGFFDTYERLQAAIEYFKTKPGFCDNPCAFSFRRREVTGEIKNDVIFDVCVYIHSEDYEFEHTIDLGLFGEENSAKEALSVYCTDNETLIRSDGLIVEQIIARSVIGKYEWQEGFSFG